MLQIRERGGKEWFRPDRDLVNAFQGILSDSLVYLQPENMSPEMRAKLDPEKAEKLAHGLADLFKLCYSQEATPVGLRDEINKLEAECGDEYEHLARTFLRVVFHRYQKYRAEMVPENADGTIDVAKLKNERPEALPAERPKEAT